MIGQYELLRPIGRGGQGDVHLARDTRLNRRVAIKAVRADLLSNSTARSRFLREARIASELVHPYVATVFDVVEENESVYLVMEYVEGTSLSDLIAANTLSQDARTRVGIELCQAVSAVHAKGLIHRDIKPNNILVTKDGHPKLLDFGLARTAQVAASSGLAETVSLDQTQTNEITSEGSFVGTLAYMSPEQIRGESLTRTSDLFSLGVVIHETISGEHPFRKRSSAETISAILSQPPKRSDTSSISASPELSFILDKVLSKTPDKRYANAEEIARDLELFQKGELATTLRWNAAVRRVRFSAVLALLLIVAGGIGAWAYNYLSTVPSWDKPRVAVAFAPLQPVESREADSDIAPLIARLASIELSSSRLMRSVGPDELAPHLRRAAQSTAPSNRALALSRTVSFDYLLDGSLHREGQRLIAAVHLVPSDGGEPVASFRVESDRPSDLADQLAYKLRRALPGVPLVVAWRDDQVQVEAITSNSAEAQVRFEASLRARREGRLNDAIAQLEATLATDPEFALAHLELSNALADAGYSRRARDSVSEAVRLAPSGNDPAEYRLRLLAESRYAQLHGRLTEANTTLRRLAELFPDDPQILAAYADNLRTVGERAASESVLRKLEPLDPLNPRWRIQLSGVVSDEKEASQLIERAEQLHQLIDNLQGLGDAAIAAGDLRMRTQRFAEAQASYELAVQRFSAAELPLLAAEARVLVAAVDIQRGRFGPAMAMLDQAEVFARESGNFALLADIQSRRGAADFASGRLDIAEKSLRESIDLSRMLENDQLLLDPLQNLSYLLVYKGKNEQARQAAARTIEAAQRANDDQRVQLARLTLAGVHYQLGDLREAESVLTQVEQEATEASISSAWAHLNLAELYEVRGELKKALDHAITGRDAFTSAGLSDTGVYGTVRIGQIRATLGQFELARASLEQARTALSRTPNPDARARLELARAHLALKRGDFSQSARIARRALALPASQAPIIRVPLLTVRCTALTLEGKTERARRTCEQALSVHNSPVPELMWARIAALRALPEKTAEVDHIAELATMLAVPLAHARALELHMQSLPAEQRAVAKRSVVASLKRFLNLCGLDECLEVLSTPDFEPLQRLVNHP